MKRKNAIGLPVLTPCWSHPFEKDGDWSSPRPRQSVLRASATTSPGCAIPSVCREGYLWSHTPRHWPRACSVASTRSSGEPTRRRHLASHHGLMLPPLSSPSLPTVTFPPVRRAPRRERTAFHSSGANRSSALGGAARRVRAWDRGPRDATSGIRYSTSALMSTPPH